MPSQYFHFRSDDRNWNAPLHTQQCEFIRPADHHRCRNRVVIGAPLCWIHRKKEQHVEVRESNIPGAGKGVFATNGTNNHAIVFRTGTALFPYKGQHIDDEEIQRRYAEATAPYGIKLMVAGRELYEDGALERGIGSLPNHANQNHANIKFYTAYPRSEEPLIKEKAVKNIRNGDELLVNYGRQYGMNEEGVEYSTNRKKNTL